MVSTMVHAFVDFAANHMKQDAHPERKTGSLFCDWQPHTVKEGGRQPALDQAAFAMSGAHALGAKASSSGVTAMWLV